MESIAASIHFSRHGSVRMEQRGIKPSMVSLVLSHGKVIRRQGLRFYFVPKVQSKAWNPQDIEYVRDLIVITDQQGLELITCYRNPAAIKAIKRKSKWLRKSQAEVNRETRLKLSDGEKSGIRLTQQGGVS